jgi:gamma-glutamylcyclotransferase (GGCT)/AIG2-like uncharacterized protein YtfP
MQFDGDKLNIPLDLKHGEINEIKEFIMQRLDYIEEIGFEETKITLPSTSSLLAFLISLKKTKPSLKIEMIDENLIDFGKFGKAHWICHG